jgi:uncharacterized protein YecE (DUF72 family)
LRLRVGTSGYQFADWYGTAYPEKLRKSDALEYYNQVLGFDSVEVNYTYYRLPTPKTSASMAAKVRDGFEFAVRSHSEMTHDIWEDRERTKVKDTGDVFERFIEGVAPLRDAGKLGSILLQFPYGFWPNSATYEYLSLCVERLSAFNVNVEFRNQGWMRESMIRFLKKQRLGYCIVDEPKLKGLHPFVPLATTATGYLRLHGRNTAWFKASKDERYNYLYSQEQLKEILRDMNEVVNGTVKTYVFFNNCYGGQALQNGLMLKKMVGLLEEMNAGQRFALDGGKGDTG